MIVRELTKHEIEQKFSQMGDYVGIDYLSSCLTKHLDFDTKKFVLVKLCGLCEAKRMFSESISLFVTF